MTVKSDEQYMRQALKEAEQALQSMDRPVGAAIVVDGQVIARSHHQVKLLKDPTAHAAVIAITQAAGAKQSDQLTDATVYVTQEPCAMCVGAVLMSGAARLVFGVADRKAGACGSVIDLTSNERLNRRLVVTKDILAGECAALLRKVLMGLFQKRQKRKTGRHEAGERRESSDRVSAPRESAGHPEDPTPKPKPGTEAP